MGQKISARINAPAGSKIRTARLQQLALEPEKCAKAVELVYVSDSQPGIRRFRKGKGFFYRDGREKVDDAEEIARIKKLRIPPAWRSVWICKAGNGHIQATGLDKLGRKQYRYHPAWNEFRNHTKFSRLLLFGEKLALIRLRLEQDMAQQGLTEAKVLATVIGLMERTYIRIGNSGYEKLYGSYGLTTLKDQHVKIEGSKISFSFKGKKGIYHNVSVKSRRLARIVKQCKELPGRELFQYRDERGALHAIDSGRVNAYIREITGEDFTAKDFRTWAGTLNALRAFILLGDAETESGRKKKIVEALDFVSAQLGNSRSVCKKYYVHPVLLELYEKQSLNNYLRQLEHIEKKDELTGWTAEEQLLMKILRSELK